MFKKWILSEVDTVWWCLNSDCVSSSIRVWHNPVSQRMSTVVSSLSPWSSALPARTLTSRIQRYIALTAEHNNNQESTSSASEVAWSCLYYNSMNPDVSFRMNRSYWCKKPKANLWDGVPAVNHTLMIWVHRLAVSLIPRVIATDSPCSMVWLIQEL